MARLCVRITPNENLGDPSLTPLRTAPGDVVELVDDPHKFSFAELNNGQYRIIDVPGVPQEKLIYLCDHAEDKDGQMIQRRVRAVDPKADPKLPDYPKEVQDVLDSRDVYFQTFDALVVVAPDLVSAAVAASVDDVADPFVPLDPAVQKAAEDFTLAKVALQDSLAAVDEKDPAIADYIANAVAAVGAISFVKPVVAVISVDPIIDPIADVDPVKV